MFFRKAWYFLKRDILEALSYKSQVILETVQIIANCSVFFFLAQYFRAELEKSFFGGTNAASYFPYVLLGMAFTDFQAISLRSFSNTIYKEMGYGTLEEILVSRTSLFQLMLASFIWSILYASARVCLYIVLGLFVFKLRLPNLQILPTLTVLVLTMSATAGFGLISAGNALLLKRGDPLEYAIRGLSKLFSGVYFPVSILPVWIQGVSWLLPLTPALKGIRKCIMESGGFGDIAPEILILLAFSVLTIPVGIFYFHWTFYKARREGLLNFA